MSAPQFFFPNSPQPGLHVERVRYTNSARLWFERDDTDDGVVWRSQGPASNGSVWSWQQLNADDTLVDCTGEDARGKR